MIVDCRFAGASTVGALPLGGSRIAYHNSGGFGRPMHESPTPGPWRGQHLRVECKTARQWGTAMRSDAQIELDVVEELADEQDVGNGPITTHVDGGVVRLTGPTPTYAAKPPALRA